jgi:excisionase family DNA binding protein
MMEPGALDKKSAAAYLGIGLRTLERLINHGEMPIIKLGRRVVIRKEALDAFLKAREHRRGPSEASLSYPSASSPQARQDVAKPSSVRR